MCAPRIRCSICARVIALALVFAPRASLADGSDAIEDVHVRGDESRGFESRTKVDDSRVVTDAASLLEVLPGIHVRRLGADDGFATLSIRGSASNEVAFYLAGVPLPVAADPTVDLSTLPLWPGSQARVYRTFTPAALGPGSLGGTLSIDAPSASGPERTDVWMAGGSFGALRMRIADVRDLGGGVRVASGLSANRTDGDFSFYNINHNAPIFDPREYLPRVNNDYAQASGLVSLIAPLHFGESHSGTMHATALLQERSQGLPGTALAPTPFERLRTDRELATVELAFPIARGTVSTQVWGVREGTEFHDAPNPFQPTFETTTIFSTGGNVAWRARFDSLSLAAKLDARGERYEPGDYAGALSLTGLPTGATREALGVGADATLRASRKVTLAASARGDVWNDAQNDSSAPSDLTARPSANVGVDADLGAVSFAAHGGYTSRPANFVERFGSPGGFLPTPNLLPESAFTIDGGARFRKKLRKLTLEGELDAFAQYALDLITFEYTGSQRIPKATNIGQASLAGVEATLIARFFGAEIRASYTGLFTRNDDDGLLGAPLPYRPAHDFVLDASYVIGPFRFRYSLDALADETIDEAGLNEVPSRVLQNIGVQMQVPRLRDVRLSIDIRNMFDVRTVEYAQGQLNGATLPYPVGDVYFYPLPGRSFLISLAWILRSNPREAGSR